jgi:hypothetical protein
MPGPSTDPNVSIECTAPFIKSPFYTYVLCKKLAYPSKKDCKRIIPPFAVLLI